MTLAMGTLHVTQTKGTRDRLFEACLTCWQFNAVPGIAIVGVAEAFFIDGTEESFIIEATGKYPYRCVCTPQDAVLFRVGILTFPREDKITVTCLYLGSAHILYVAIRQRNCTTFL